MEERMSTNDKAYKALSFRFLSKFCSAKDLVKVSCYGAFFAGAALGIYQCAPQVDRRFIKPEAEQILNKIIKPAMASLSSAIKKPHV